MDSFNSFGTNELIKQGAKLVTCVDDILGEFSLFQDRVFVEDQILKDRAQSGIGQDLINDDSEASVYSLISAESLYLDELVEKTRLDIPRVSDILLRLQIRGLVKQLAGKQFVRSV